jgi:hypothetical protein
MVGLAVFGRESRMVPGRMNRMRSSLQGAGVRQTWVIRYVHVSALTQGTVLSYHLEKGVVLNDNNIWLMSLLIPAVIARSACLSDKEMGSSRLCETAAYR